MKASEIFGQPSVHHSSNLIANPRVSVILPTYCRGDSGLLQRSIESVLSQTMKSFELIILDDGSTDSSANVISKFVGLDNRVIHVRFPHNSGLPAVRVNQGLLMARGSYCAYQFDDDQWTPQMLEVLVDGLDANPEFDVAHGKCLYQENGNTYELGGPYDYSKIVNANYIANNSLIHRKSVFERFGGYDMHLLMRRLCDWDLWLRWGKEVRFLFVNKPVSIVEAMVEGSLGKTVRLDCTSARYHMGTVRNSKLTPESIPHYDIANLDHLSHLPEEYLQKLWARDILPFLSCRNLKTSDHIRPGHKRYNVVTVKSHFDTTIDITINNFKELLSDQFEFTYFPQDQVDESVVDTADILLLNRTIDEHALELAKAAKQRNKAVAFFMDDDLLNFHELDASFSYLKPGTPSHNALQRIIKTADMVATYSDLMQESVTPLNSKNIRLETNIRDSHLTGVRSKLLATKSYPKKRIIFAGGNARSAEFADLWEAITRIDQKYHELVEFHFWGYDPVGRQDLRASNFHETFTFSYEEYVSRLSKVGFDIMIVPLFDKVRAKRAKCPIKFLEATVAGAIGVYSDVEPYKIVQQGVHGIKCKNDVESWAHALEQAILLRREDFNLILENSLELIEKEFTTESQKTRLANTLTATLLQRQLRRNAINEPAPRGTLSKELYQDRPKIAYFCHSPHKGGAEQIIFRHAVLTKAYGFNPVIVLPVSFKHLEGEIKDLAAKEGITVDYCPLIVETEFDHNRKPDRDVVDYIANWLSFNDISLVHSVTLMREVGQAAHRVGVPHVASLYQTDSKANSDSQTKTVHCDLVHSDSFLYGNLWSDILNCQTARVLSWVPDTFFEASLQNNREDQPAPAKRPAIGVFGTIQPRKGQKEAIQAVAMLKENHGLECKLNLFGYEKFHSEYVQQCKRLVKSLGIEDLVTFHGFTADTSEAMRAQDIVLCASGAESLPQAILEAMACKCLVVSTSAGGIAEVLTERTGVIVRSNSVDSLTHGLLRALNLNEEEKGNRKQFAYQFVFQHCSKDYVTGELLNAYLFATENVAKKRPMQATATNENQSNNFTPGHFPKKKKKTSERIAKAVRKAIRQSRDLIIRLIPKQIRLLTGAIQRTA